MGSVGVRVELLGSIRARRDGEPVRLRGMVGRSVLAKLALAKQHSRAVSVDTLVDALWSADQPADPAANVHTAISRLRRTLGPDAIETVGHGYRLARWVTTDVADLEHSLVEAGRPEIVSAGDQPRDIGLPADSASADRIQALLAAAGDEPLQDVAATTGFESERVRLVELLALAGDRVAELLIAKGRADQAVPELVHRIDTVPLRERTNLLLAEALTRTGRYTEAMRVIARYRHRVQETGMEVSPRVDELEQQILAGGFMAPPEPGIGRPLTVNLPTPSSRLVGRSVEIDEVIEMLADHPLVTLTGVGGSGKTRLALAVADALSHRHPNRFSDGIVFVDLAVVTEGPIAGAVVDAAALRIAVRSGESSTEAVARFVARRRMLLILDNCEHIVDAAYCFVRAVLGFGPMASILATSRLPLEADGEHVFRVPTLAVEGPGSDAVALLMERAGAGDHRFSLDAEGERRAAELCRRLDGLPLAVELAAAQMVHTDISMLADHLDDRLQLLRGRRHHIDRHQTLQAMMEWSWGLLDPEDRQLLAGLSVFTGTFSAAGAQAIHDDESDRPMVQSLRRLVVASLLEVRRRDGNVRYGLLETVRLFAREKLEEAGRTEEVVGRHRDWLLAWVAGARFDEQSLSGVWIADFTDELDNIVAAVEWSMMQNDWEAAARLVTAGSGTWRRGIRSGWAVRTTARLLGHDLSGQVRRRLLMAAADAAMSAGDYRIMTDWTFAALDSARNSRDRTTHALAAIWAAFPFLLSDHHRGMELNREGHLVADTPLVRSWTSHALIYARHMTSFGRPMIIDEVEHGPVDSVARGGMRELAAINDAFGGRIDDARRHLDWFRVHGDSLSPIRETAHVVPVLVDALAGNPAVAIDRAPDAAKQMWRTTETVGRAELLLAVAIARYRMGHVGVAGRHLENLRGRPMVHPVFHDLRRRFSRLSGKIAADHDVVGDDGLSGPTESEIERFLLGELGDRVVSADGT